MRKVLLVYPKFPHRLPALNISMSLVYLGSYLCSRGYTVRIIDACNVGSREELYSQIKSESRDALAVGLSAMTAQVPRALEISQMVRDINPRLPIIWGGVHSTLFPEQVAASKLVDFVVRGEGEITAAELLEQIQAGNLKPKEVKGIAYKARNSEEIVVTPVREFLNMDELPFVEWGLLEGVTPVRDLAKVARLTSDGLSLQTTRGCPWHCAFCINSVLKQSYRYRRLDLVVQDIRRLVGLGVGGISFLDEDFFANRRRGRAFAASLKETGLSFKWSATCRADYLGDTYLNRELLSELKKVGLHALGIGVESGSEKILKMLKKEITCQNILVAAELLDEAGIECMFSFMMGLPQENEEDVQATLQLIRQIIERDSSLSFAILGPQVYRPYPGSVLYLECKEHGMKVPTALEEWADSPYLSQEYKRKELSFYPWLRVPPNRLMTMGFYGWLCGIKLPSCLLAKLVRRIALWRCKKLFFRYPIEMKTYYAIAGTWVDRFLQRGIFE